MKSKTKAILVDILGFLCIIASPFIGWLPGPGGFALLILGLSLLANNHEWAERLMGHVKTHTGSFAKYITDASPRMRIAIDVLSIVFVALAVLIVTQVTRDIFKTAAISLVIASVILVLTNQRRYEKLLPKSKRKHKQ